MPNIEVHGLGLPDTTYVIAQMIRKELQNKSWGYGIVTTCYPSICLDMSGHESPFFRIIYTEEDQIEQIIELLQKIYPKIDIECLKLSRFIKAK